MHESAFWTTPVLASVRPVVEHARHVTTHPEAVRSVAGWMAYEEFGLPDGMLQFDLGSDLDLLTDTIMFVSLLNFAFTDFTTRVKYEVDYFGKRWTDSEGMFANIHEAIVTGVPILDGAWMAKVDRAGLERLFRGTIEMPMLDERVQVLNDAGAVLLARYGGRFHNWVQACAPAMYAGGDGLLERLVTEFPRFNDVSTYDGHQVRLFKLAQLSLWSLHAIHSRLGGIAIRDLSNMTAFADYIVPVGLRVMGITSYTPELEARINRGDIIHRDSAEEIEIRAHTLYATALLTEEINKLRPSDMQLVIPQVDYRFWKTYHATFWPHHLTRTVMY
ncbi:MAG: queuosine salvage family protein [Chloroflexota bacterium]